MQTPDTTLLLDLENTVPADLGRLGNGFKIKAFLGSHQTKVPVDFARALQAFGAAAEYIQMEGAGHNALDFHIAYYLGLLVAKQPADRFVIVSKDAGFDPLIAHLRGRNIRCERIPSLARLIPAETPGTQCEEKLAKLIADLSKLKNSRPRTLKTLSSTIRARFPKALAEEQLDWLLKQLQRREIVTESNGKLTYQFPEPPEDVVQKPLFPD